MTDYKVYRDLTRKAHNANVAANKKSAEARVLSAEAVYAVTRDGIIGQEGSPWQSQKDYALALSVSEGSITGLKRLGKALALGCSPSDASWPLLSSKAGTKEVGAAIDAEDASPQSIYKTLAETFKPDGRRVSQVSDDVTTAAEKAAAATKKKASDLTARDFSALLNDFRTAYHDMSEADQEKVEASMLRFVADGRKRRDALKEKAAKDAKASEAATA